MKNYIDNTWIATNVIHESCFKVINFFNPGLLYKKNGFLLWYYSAIKWSQVKFWWPIRLVQVWRTVIKPKCHIFGFYEAFTKLFLLIWLKNVLREFKVCDALFIMCNFNFPSFRRFWKHEMKILPNRKVAPAKFSNMQLFMESWGQVWTNTLISHQNTTFFPIPWRSCGPQRLISHYLFSINATKWEMKINFGIGSGTNWAYFGYFAL